MTNLTESPCPSNTHTHKHHHHPSWQLETDEEMLLKKARGSIAKYHVDLVVANMLQTRKEIVRLVDSDGVTDVLVGDHAWIEKPLIAAIADAHTVFITGGAGPADA